MTFEEEVLNCLADGDETICQIRQQLDFYEVDYNKEKLLSVILKLIQDGDMYIVYPNNASVEEYQNASEEDRKYIFFRMTEQGRERWDNISD